MHICSHKVSNVYSMTSLGLANYSLADYIHLYSTRNNITSALVYPIGLTNMKDATYVVM